MKIRALQTAQVILPKRADGGGGAIIVRGPELNEDGSPGSPGDTIEVPDDFVVNRDVFEVVVPPAGGPGKVKYVPLPKGEKAEQPAGA